MTTIAEIKGFFDKHNIEITLVYVNDYPELEMTFEDALGQTVCLDHFWEHRIKAHNLIPKEK